MEKWFKTNSFRTDIVPVMVVKETPTRVTLEAKNGFKERVANKRSSYENYFPSWEDAHAHLLARHESRVSDARRSLELANSSLGNVKGMKKPMEAA